MDFLLHTQLAETMIFLKRPARNSIDLLALVSGVFDAINPGVSHMDSIFGCARQMRLFVFGEIEE